MIFKQWQQIFDGTKTQTRILVKKRQLGTEANRPNEYLDIHTEHTWYWYNYPPHIYKNVIYRVGGTYPFYPQRAAKAIGFFHITRIRQENIQNIIEADARAEGFNSIAEFAKFWNRGKYRARRWEANPRVWVLDFELVERIESD